MGLKTLISVEEFDRLEEPDELSYERLSRQAKVLANGEWTNVAPGEVIVEQGEVGDAFYAIRSGQVEVVADGTIVRTLGPGSYFGEVALLLDVPRTATVRAKTAVRAYRLDRSGFDGLVASAFKKGTLNPQMAQDRTWQH